MGIFSKKTTIGHKYYLGMHFVACLGPVDEVQEIRVGDKEAWSGVNTGTYITISENGLFGGEEKEGGIAGVVDVDMGKPTQAKNTYLVSALTGQEVPAYRGVLSFILNQVYIGTSPYLKNWDFVAKRTDIKYRDVAQWYSAKADISGDMNPAHIFHEIITEPWGLNYSSSGIDDTNFKAVADVLFTEGFGLSFFWSAFDKIGAFIKTVEDHIGGRCFIHPYTGLWTLKLIRDDYDIETVPTLDNDDSELLSFSRRGWGETTNKIVLVYTNEDTLEDDTVEVQSLANVLLQGAKITSQKTFTGIRNYDLAAKVATRELLIAGSPLAKATLSADRSAYTLIPGDVFKYTNTQMGINGVAYRVISTNSGELKRGKITLEVIEDHFGLPTTHFTSQQDGWTDPNAAPADATYVKLVEATYYEMLQLLDNPDDAPNLVGCRVMTLANTTQASISNYDLWAAPVTLILTSEDEDFTPTMTLSGTLTETSTSISYSANIDVSFFVVGGFGYIGDEIVQFDSIDTGAKTAVIKRGMIDTVPQSHATLERIWLADGFQGFDETSYVAATAVKVKALTKGIDSILAIGSATEHSITPDNRVHKPYPPSDVKINNSSYPSTVDQELTFSWKHRDRLTQDTLIAQSAASIGPESGVTYTLKLYNENDSLVRTETGLTGTSYTWVEATEIADSGLGRLNDHVRFELFAVRSSYNSHQTHDIEFDRTYA